MTIRENIYKRKSLDYFNRSATSYDQSDPMQITYALVPYVLKNLAPITRPAILDVGCGTGELLSQLVAQSYDSLAGLDLAPNMVGVAREKLGNTVELRIGDAEAIPWDSGTFDCVLCTLSLHHYPHPERALAEMRRVLRPGGLLILADVTMPTPLRQLSNLILPTLSTGDRHFYSQFEVVNLLHEVGFVTTNWQKIYDSAFFVTAS